MIIDFGFHAPTMSFRVAGTLIIEPTESESLVEIDWFCNAMLAIAAEIKKFSNGIWPHAYSRQQAGAPSGDQQSKKYWPPIARVDNAFGDPNLACTCPPMEMWENAAE